MATIGYAIDGLSRGQASWSWVTDPHLHEEAHRAVAAAFRLVQPKGYPPKPKARAAADVAPPSGRIGFELLWNELRLFDPKAKSFDARKGPRRIQHERRLATLRAGLGTSLLNRAVLWGQTGRQALRAHRARAVFPVAKLSEFAQLSRKRIAEGLTPEEHARFVTLFNEYPGRETLKLGDLSNPGPFPELKLEDTQP
jgi:hypothetical protein